MNRTDTAYTAGFFRFFSASKTMGGSGGLMSNEWIEFRANQIVLSEIYTAA